MKRDMKKWVADMIASPVKKPLPVLSFPSVQLMNITVRDLISSSDLQAEGMKRIAEATPAAASVSLMDLSVEAEAFGSTIRVSDDEVPTVTGAIITEPEDAENLVLPEIGTARTGLYIEAIEKAVKLITDRPVFAGIIGPFSLAGRLTDVSEVMILCYDEPEMIHTLMEKCTQFAIDYCKAYKAVGAHGVVIAEPLTGLMSPTLADEFSHPYLKKLVDAVQDDSFAVIYHNCGNNVPLMTKGIYSIGAMGYHFGDAIHLKDMFNEDAPTDALIMGNVSPAKQFRNGTVESITEETKQVMSECCDYPNFVISSGCDIPPLSSWDNINAFFKAAQDFYANK